METFNFRLMDWLSFFDFQFTRILTLTFDIFSPSSTHIDLLGGERSNQETVCFSHEEFFLPKRFLENFLKEISLLTKETQWSQRYRFSFLCEWVKVFLQDHFEVVRTKTLKQKLSSLSLNFHKSVLFEFSN